MLLQATISGLAAGAVFGLVAIGFTVVAGTVRVLHLAHGDVVVAAVLTAVVVVLGRTPVATQLSPPRAVAFALLVLASAAALAGLLGLFAVRPFLADAAADREGDALGWLAGLVAAGLVLREVFGLLLPQEAYAVPDPFRLDAFTGVLALPGGGALPGRVLVVLAIALVIGVIAERVLVRSRFGKALRAFADDAEAAALCGVAGRRVVVVAFACAGLLAGIAGLLDAPGRAFSVEDGVVLGFAGMAAALLGGLGSARGALLGGLGLGVVQAWVVQADARYADVVPLVLVVALLALRPRDRVSA